MRVPGCTEVWKPVGEQVAREAEAEALQTLSLATAKKRKLPEDSERFLVAVAHVSQGHEKREVPEWFGTSDPRVCRGFRAPVISAR